MKNVQCLPGAPGSRGGGGPAPGGGGGGAGAATPGTGGGGGGAGAEPGNRKHKNGQQINSCKLNVKEL